MKVCFDAKMDTLSVLFRESVEVVESEEVSPGVILDYDKVGNAVSLEILDVSQRGIDLRRIEYRISGRF